MVKLKTRNVFLDTEAFRSTSFNYGSTPFRKLTELAQADEIRVFITDITLKEMKALIREEVAKAIRAQQSFEQKAYIIRNCRSKLIRARLEPLDPNKVEMELLRQLKRFLKDAKVIVLCTNRVKIADVFDRYFAMESPFGPDRKKNEFPDAFAVAAVRDCCTKDKQEIYIVSADPDMRAVCGDGALHSVEKLAEFLDLVASHNERLVAFVKEQISNVQKEIINDIERQFEELGFVLQDHDGDVDDVTVVKVVLGEMDILEAADDEATLETEAEVTFEAELSYGDEGTAIYDSEDKTVSYINHVRETVTRTEYISVEINVLYEDRDPSSFEINDVSIERKTILVRTDLDEGWPYK
jgi:hypothetical protein